jgi:uncharacterized protein YjbJ (UPF0337 family)
MHIRPCDCIATSTTPANISVTHLFIKSYETKLLMIFMSEKETNGKIKQGKGKVREGLGKITGNKSEQIKGKVEQVEGKVQEEVGKAKRKA